MGILGAPIGTVATYAVALFVSLIIYGSKVKRSLPIVRACLAPCLTALASVILARAAYDRLYFLINERILLLMSIALAALIYLVLLTFFGILSPKKIEKVAKYTKMPE